MKIKTADLTGPALRYCVAVCEGLELGENNVPIWFDDDGLDAPRVEYSPCKSWNQGGPIIEREKIAIDWDHDCCNAYVYGFAYGGYSSGPTALVAAMRNYVTSKLGDEVDIPEELL